MARCPACGKFVTNLSRHQRKRCPVQASGPPAETPVDKPTGGIHNILMTFLTDKGCKAYYSVEAEGKKQSWKERQIANRVCEDRVINKDPLKVQIDVKIAWLAVQVDLPTQIEAGLEKFGAVKDKDYTMEVSWK